MHVRKQFFDCYILSGTTIIVLMETTEIPLCQFPQSNNFEANLHKKCKGVARERFCMTKKMELSVNGR